MEEMGKIPGYYTPDEAAKILKIGVQAVSKLVKKGVLNPVGDSRPMLFHQWEVEAAKHRPKPGNPNFGRKRQSA